MALSYATPPAPATLPRIEDVPAAHLTGRQLKDGWRVAGPLNQATHPTGGFFSYSYSVVHDDGREAFMKALNIAAALAPGGDVLAQLKMFADTFAFERDLLAHCVDKKLSRIIKLLAHGDVDIPEAGVLRSVPYLIFELADGDINEHRAKLAAFDLAWVLRVLKHSTVGIEQLHSAGTAHQDLRPSNVLTQDGGKEMNSEILAGPIASARLGRRREHPSLALSDTRRQNSCMTGSTRSGNRAGRPTTITLIAWPFNYSTDKT
jgi:serine/threonine protein kinase